MYFLLHIHDVELIKRRDDVILTGIFGVN